jgi:predicted short-subunit dehydrogenase-like oxidoreductase (DUF2520 family)
MASETEKWPDAGVNTTSTSWPDIVVCGYGRVGTSLAWTFASAGRSVTVVELPEVMARGRHLPEGIRYAPSIAAVPATRNAAAWFLCVPDMVLSESVMDLAADGSPFKRGIDCVALTSATFDTEPLSAMSGLPVGRAHPLHPFAPVEQASDVPPGTPFATHGLPDWAVRLLSESGFRPFDLAPENRHLYHAAAVLVSNLPAALAHGASAIFGKCGVPDGAHHALAMLSNLAEVLRQEGVSAVPGPAARGDMHTVRADQAALDAADRDLADVHRILSRIIADDIIGK